jgi:hypothetical protein
MDMMEIGNGALTIKYAAFHCIMRYTPTYVLNSEQRTHFAMWAALKSPILLGTDVCAHNTSFSSCSYLYNIPAGSSQN